MDAGGVSALRAADRVSDPFEIAATWHNLRSLYWQPRKMAVPKLCHADFAPI
jgi:hypothetical protein